MVWQVEYSKEGVEPAIYRVNGIVNAREMASKLRGQGFTVRILNKAPSLDAAVPASGGVEAVDLVDNPLANEIATIIEQACVRHGVHPEDVEGTLDDAGDILNLIGSGGELPAIPDDDADFTPDLARKIIAGYQALLLATSASEPAGGVREADELKRQLAYVAKAHAHHALWIGLPTDSIEAFGRALAFRIYQSILKKTAALSAPASSSPAEAEAKEGRADG